MRPPMGPPMGPPPPLEEAVLGAVAGIEQLRRALLVELDARILTIDNTLAEDDGDAAGAMQKLALALLLQLLTMRDQMAKFTAAFTEGLGMLEGGGR